MVSELNCASSLPAGDDVSTQVQGSQELIDTQNNQTTAFREPSLGSRRHIMPAGIEVQNEHCKFMR